MNEDTDNHNPSLSSESEVTPKVRSILDLVSKGLDKDEKLNHLVSGPRRKRLTKGLFWEWAYSTPKIRHLAYFTLKDTFPKHYVIRDGIPRYSLKQIYLAVGDITEHEFVSKFFWDEAHWKNLSERSFFKDEIESWREELRQQKKSELVSILEQDANSSSKTSTMSAKYLLDKIYGTPTKPRLGRPPKEEQVKVEEVDKKTNDMVKDSLERIRLVK